VEIFEMFGRCQFAIATLLAITPIALGCGGDVTSSSEIADASIDTAAPSTGDGGAGGDDANAGDIDTGASSSNDAGGQADADPGPPADAGPPKTYPPDPGDGTTTRITCTNKLGSGLTASFGRLDGTIVSIVPPKQHNCNGDSTHVHLQVLANGGTYDIAVNVDALFAEKDAPLLNEPWAEGWHTTGEKLDYPSMLALHSTAFGAPTIPELTQTLEAELAAVNHISVFATGYGVDGAHLVHRNGASNDGALVLHPIGAQPHYLLFNFTGQTF
jgi:hypothetical protein